MASAAQISLRDFADFLKNTDFTDLAQDSLPQWAGGGKITPNQINEIAVSTAPTGASASYIAQTAALLTSDANRNGGGVGGVATAANNFINSIIPSSLASFFSPDPSNPGGLSKSELIAYALLALVGLIIVIVLINAATD